MELSIVSSFAQPIGGGLLAAGPIGGSRPINSVRVYDDSSGFRLATADLGLVAQNGSLSVVNSTRLPSPTFIDIVR